MRVILGVIIIYVALVISVFVLVAVMALSTFAQPVTKDPRYCGPPARSESGRIERSKQVLNDFKRMHPCPSTKAHSGACPGWAIDHVIPLACGGCDAIMNLQWLPNNIKSGPEPDDKDRWERVIYCQ